MKWLNKTHMTLYWLLIVMMLLCSACTTATMREYYSEEENYLTATGIISHYQYDIENDALYLEFSQLEPAFDDICFKIVGQNLSVVQENGIDQKVQVGDCVTFVTAPMYFGDGYVFPIVALSIDDEVLLEYEIGLTNFLSWLQ